MKTCLIWLVINLLNFENLENLLKLVVDTFCEKLPSFMSNIVLVLDSNLFDCCYSASKTTATTITTKNKTFMGLRENNLSTRSYIYIFSLTNNDDSDVINLVT